MPRTLHPLGQLHLQLCDEPHLQIGCEAAHGTGTAQPCPGPISRWQPFWVPPRLPSRKQPWQLSRARGFKQPDIPRKQGLPTGPAARLPLHGWLALSPSP